MRHARPAGGATAGAAVAAACAAVAAAGAAVAAANPALAAVSCVQGSVAALLVRRQVIGESFRRLLTVRFAWRSSQSAECR